MYDLRSKVGFALVVVLGLVGFLTVIVVGFSMWVIMEKGLDRDFRDIERARGNALIGLRVALGELQRLAGSDRRVTAEADILSEKYAVDASKRHWVGVWESGKGDLRKRFKGWLVSGAGTEGADVYEGLEGAIRDGIELVEEDAVCAERVKIGMEEGGGHYAYWVGDEGVKGKEEGDGFHDYTDYTSSILVNSVTGGLKKDLLTFFENKTGYEDEGIFARPEGISGNVEIPTWALLKRFYGFTREIENGAIEPRPFIVKKGDREVMDQGIGPIILGYSLGVAPEIEVKGNTARTLHIRFHHFRKVLLWNPYDVALMEAEYVLEILVKHIQFQFQFNIGNKPKYSIDTSELKFVKAFEAGEVKYIHDSWATNYETLLPRLGMDSILLKKARLASVRGENISLKLSLKEGIIQELKFIKPENREEFTMNLETKGISEPVIGFIFKRKDGFENLSDCNFRAPIFDYESLFEDLRSEQPSLDWVLGDALELDVIEKKESALKIARKKGDIRSLAYFQNANMTRHFHNPGYTIGASKKPSYILGERTLAIGKAEKMDNVECDYSYLLNEALWDDYGILQEGKVTCEGMLNVNSTSWRAWQYHLRDLEMLTAEERRRLAIAMVKQVKERGPFCSLSQFINRELKEGKGALSEWGTIGAAIEDAGLLEGLGEGDILEDLGAKITPRSDTFIIRAYGDAEKAFTGNKKTRASCEAIAQRIPEYLNKGNTHLGRSFSVLKFRWINED